MKFDDKKFIAEVIKTNRKKMNLTQAELAERVDLSDQHISRIESGCYIPSLKSFFMIVNALNIDLKVFGFNQKPSNNPIKDKLTEQILSSTDAELIFYENLIQAAKTSFDKVKKELL